MAGSNNLFLLNSCDSKSDKKTIDSPLTNNRDISKSNKLTDSILKNKANKKVSQDSASVFPPTQAEERERLKKTYNVVKTIDTTFINTNDTLHLHLKYYCLKDSELVEPKGYDPDTKNAKEFVTYPFVSGILLLSNRDTVLKRQFKAIDFNPFYKDNFDGDLKKYGSILMPELVRKNEDKSRIVLDYPIAVPATDIGIGLFLIISKNGNYKIVENY